MIDQQQRHHYLATMGIPQWLPRTQLPGASPSADWVDNFVAGQVLLDEGYEDPVAIEDAPAVAEQAPVAKVAEAAPSYSSPKPIAAKVEVPELVAEPSKPVQAATITPDQPLITTPITPLHSTRQAPNMRLMFWSFSDTLVIDSMPPQQRGTLVSKHYSSLLNNLLRAIDRDVQREQKPFSLNWPVLAGDVVDQGWEQAVSAVQFKLQEFWQQPPSLVLLLGEAAAQMVLERQESLDELRGMTFSLRSSTKALASDSLTMMMQLPDCKREVWRDLQAVLPS